MAYYDSYKQLIGNTPIVKLTGKGFPDGVEMFAKLETYNPTGSVKDRGGYYMVADAEKRGILKPGGTIVDCTSGNMGLGIAFAALEKGYKVIMVITDKVSAEKRALLRALGAELEVVPNSEGMAGAGRKVDEILHSVDGAITMSQFANPANMLAHYETTGPEIYRDLDGKIDYFIAGAGTGATFTGVMKYLREQDNSIKSVLVDPIGSVYTCEEHGSYITEGIGNDFIPEIMDMSLIDDHININDEMAFEGSRMLVRNEGIFAGPASGACYYAAMKYAEKGHRGRFVILITDGGDRYISKGLYDFGRNS